MATLRQAFDKTASTFVGRSPAGVDWNVHRKPGEAEAAYQGRITTAVRNLAKHRDKYAQGVVRVTGLTPVQQGHAVHAVDNMLENMNMPVLVRGKTYGGNWIIAPRGILSAALEFLAYAAEDYVHNDDNYCETDAQSLFGRRMRIRSWRGAAEKIAAAIGSQVPRNMITEQDA